MNWNWYSLRRMRGALILIWIGIVFLLDESGWLHFDTWPLILIGIGAIMLAERLMPLPPPPPPPPGSYPPYPGAYGYQQQPPPPSAQQPPAPENPSTSNPGKWS